MNFRACTSPKRDYEASKRKRVGSTPDLPVPSAKRPMILEKTEGTMTIKIEEEASSQESVPPSPSGERVFTLCVPNQEDMLEILKLAQNHLSGEVTRGRLVNKKYFKQLMKQIGKLEVVFRSIAMMISPCLFPFCRRGQGRELKPPFHVMDFFRDKQYF